MLIWAGASGVGMTGDGVAVGVGFGRRCSSCGVAGSGVGAIGVAGSGVGAIGVAGSGVGAIGVAGSGVAGSGVVVARFRIPARAASFWLSKATEIRTGLSAATSTQS